ncbi:uncharacterized protein MICPUCDRAFT_57588 [Micromonas pusilla CCMP1545]|jgi:hypothetical protein|uniref:Predicted protein n=1 Tax=Micromonas pusilla (strain CCMP1545) TaxID=564608 RepID=C1MRA8_MICPC|nr:uncharacterized protein MICPUCDRAFT_57588 [Micromonas pusilla CCMP1545]EEH57850.1 predicted protein [Micromonas pusilla CCMP1545]|tara:strand:+ start:1610 stop:2149 length:540 start_codon:yes stop_codon:yes gene_type:complete|eukprot:XP_003057899.1 predicted protein [Micromonas pusilla CCMP1545]
MAKRAGGVSLWRRVTNYVKHDLREIVWPRPMDDPPGTTSVFEGLTARDHARVWSNAWREYKRGWRWYFGEPESDREERIAREKAEGTHVEDEYEALDREEFEALKEEAGRMAAAGKAMGHDGWKHQLQMFYRTRGKVYTRSIAEFVKGYREGMAESTLRSRMAQQGEEEEPPPPPPPRK